MKTEDVQEMEIDKNVYETIGLPNNYGLGPTSKFRFKNYSFSNNQIQSIHSEQESFIVLNVI